MHRFTANTFLPCPVGSFFGNIHVYPSIFADGLIPAGVAIGIGIGIEADSGFSIPIAIPTPISNPGLRLLLIFMDIATRMYPGENNT